MSESWRRPFLLCNVTCIKFCFIYIYIWGNVILSLPWVWVWFSVELPILGFFFFFILYVTLNFIHMCVAQMRISWSKVTERVCVLCVILVCVLVHMHTHTHTHAHIDQKVKNPPYFQLQDVSMIVTVIDWEGFLRLAWIWIISLVWFLTYSYTRH